jgi:hypothetical protein
MKLRILEERWLTYAEDVTRVLAEQDLIAPDQTEEWNRFIQECA